MMIKGVKKNHAAREEQHKLFVPGSLVVGTENAPFSLYSTLFIVVAADSFEKQRVTNTIITVLSVDSRSISKKWAWSVSLVMDP